MKKIFNFAFVSLICVLFFSCDLSVSSGNISRPEYRKSAGGIVIVISRENSNTKYINLYRRDVTDSRKADTVCIAMAVPSAYDSDDKTYPIEDLLVIKGNKYQYCARYACENSDGTYSYYFTDWTEEIEAASGLSDGNIEYTASGGISITYNEAAKALSFADSVSLPGVDVIKAFNKLVLVAQTDTERRAFELAASFDKEENPTVFEIAEFSILGGFPNEFLGTEVRILGIAGQKTEEKAASDSDTATGMDSSANADSAKNIYWTPITEVSLKDSSGNEIEAFTVAAETGTDGYDIKLPAD